MSKLKYCHVVEKITPGMKRALGEVPRRGGSYNWIFLFQGEMIPYRMLDDPEQYDVIGVNMAPADQMLLKPLAEKLKNSSTLLVANNDYIAESWGSWQQAPALYSQFQELADVTFGTEPHQVSCMNDNTYCIPHPHWIKMLKKIGNDDLNPEVNKIGVMYHWWEGNTYLPGLLLHKLRKEGLEFESRLYGYNGSGKDDCKSWTRIIYDKKMPLLDYPDFIRSLQTNKIFYEPCRYHTYGRTTVDTAALGIPTVGTDRVFSMKHCFPNLVCDPINLGKTKELIKKVLKGGEWLQEQMDYASEACEYFNYKNSEERYMTMVEETRKKVGK